MFHIEKTLLSVIFSVLFAKENAAMEMMKNFPTKCLKQQKINKIMIKFVY